MNLLAHATLSRPQGRNERISTVRVLALEMPGGDTTATAARHVVTLQVTQLKAGVVAQVGGLGRLALIRSGGRLAGTRKFVCRLRNLRFQVFHGSGDVEIAAIGSGKVQIERFFEFAGDIAVELLACDRLLRHALDTLYWPLRSVLL